MSCPKNIKTALWGLLRWEWLHRWKRYRIEKGCLYWRVEYECATCGAKKLVEVEDEELIRWGYDIVELREKAHVLCVDLEPKCPR